MGRERKTGGPPCSPFVRPEVTAVASRWRQPYGLRSLLPLSRRYLGVRRCAAAGFKGRAARVDSVD
jgi:hypothetical protein